jgi:hypothetical protein
LSRGPQDAPGLSARSLNYSEAVGVAMIPIIVEALRSVRHPRFFDTERGYQGELLAELRARMPEAGLPGDAVIEQE